MERFKVFISWSGDTSLAVAAALREWLPKVLQATDPWMSASDIARGRRWGTELADRLNKSAYSIVCLTADNQSEPWLLFESGALSQSFKPGAVCPYLIGLRPTDVTGPLADFQAATANRDETLSMLKAINAMLGAFRLEDSRLASLYERLWPEFEEQLRSALSMRKGAPRQRTERQMLGEILERVRGLQRTSHGRARPTRQQAYRYLSLLEEQIGPENARLAEDLLKLAFDLPKETYLGQHTIFLLPPQADEVRTNEQDCTAPQAPIEESGDR